MGGTESGFTPPWRGFSRRRGRESQDISPSETEYGCAIHCDSTDSGALRGGGAAAGDTGPTAMVGAINHRLEAGEGKGEKGKRATATSEHAGATVEETETPGLGTGAVSEPAPTRGWNTGDTGEEASLGASGSIRDEWIGAED